MRGIHGTSFIFRALFDYENGGAKRGEEEEEKALVKVVRSGVWMR